jgi:hypothetical protein
VPGIQPADVQELIEHGAKAVVLSSAALHRADLFVAGKTCRRPEFPGFAQLVSRRFDCTAEVLFGIPIL